MSSVTFGGYFWSSSFYGSATDYRSYGLAFDYNSNVFPSYSYGYRSRGFTLRCVQE